MALKKLVVLILSLQILSSGMFLDQVLRVRQLVSHYLEHRGHDHIGLGRFLALHYFDPGHDKTDPEHHASLPLHHHADTVDTIVFKGMVEHIQVSLAGPVEERYYSSIIADHHGHMPSFSVFQPPKTA